MYGRILNVFVLSLLSIITVQAQNYQLVWGDEFDTNTLGKNWNAETVSSPYNNELEYYTPRQKNVSIENGNLVITACRENYGGKMFTSGRVNSKQKVYFTHGKIEASIKLPRLANGLWPAFWMMGEDEDVHPWPACGEIDIMEMGEHGGISSNQTGRWIGGTIHWGEDAQHHQQWSDQGQHAYDYDLAGDADVPALVGYFGNLDRLGLGRNRLRALADRSERYVRRGDDLPAVADVELGRVAELLRVGVLERVHRTLLVLPFVAPDGERYGAGIVRAYPGNDGLGNASGGDLPLLDEEYLRGDGDVHLRPGDLPDLLGHARRRDLHAVRRFPAAELLHDAAFGGLRLYMVHIDVRVRFLADGFHVDLSAERAEYLLGDRPYVDLPGILHSISLLFIFSEVFTCFLGRFPLYSEHRRLIF